jgi:filamentous hemagglutinin
MIKEDERRQIITDIVYIVLYYKIAKSSGVKNTEKTKVVKTTKVKLSGSGPSKGYIEVSDNYSSSNLVKTFQGKGTDFVYDPVTKRFVMGNNVGGHTGIARVMGIDYAQESRIVGGRIFRKDGILMTDESSGHFGQNWTPEIRAQFNEFMKSFGIEQTHLNSYQ